MTFEIKKNIVYHLTTYIIHGYTGVLKVFHSVRQGILPPVLGWHPLNCINGVTQELVELIGDLKLSMHNDPLDLIPELLKWLHDCRVKAIVDREHRDTCQNCAFIGLKRSKTPYVFVLPLTRESLTSLFKRSVMEGDGLIQCNACEEADMLG